MHTKFWSKDLKEKDHSEDWRRWEDNITMDLGEIGWEVVDCINPAQDKDQWRTLVKSVMNIQVP
jgi:hypothetical protein